MDDHVIIISQVVTEVGQERLRALSSSSSTDVVVTSTPNFVGDFFPFVSVPLSSVLHSLSALTFRKTVVESPASTPRHEHRNPLPVHPNMNTVKTV